MHRNKIYPELPVQYQGIFSLTFIAMRLYVEKRENIKAQVDGT